MIWHSIVHIMGVDGVGAGGTVYGAWQWPFFWGGIAGSFLVTLVMYVVHESNKRIHKKLNVHHEQMKDLMDPTTPGGIADAVEHLKKHTEEQLNAIKR